MKIKFSLFLLTSISLLLVSCKNKPETVVEKYYTHFYKAEYKEAIKYVVKEQQGLCELLDSHIPETKKAEMAKAEVSVKNIKCEIQDDTTAICTCEIMTKTNGKEEKMGEQVKLKKIDNKWYINQGKEDFLGGAMTEDAVAPTSSEEDIIDNESSDSTVVMDKVK